MACETTFTDIGIDELVDLMAQKKEQGYRFVQVLSRMADKGIDVIYTVQKDASIENYCIRGYDPETQTIPSVTGSYLVAFPFENEAHDLFGVKITDIAIDFQGKFYDVHVDKPMTVISPAQKAAMEKKAKLEAAKAAKAAKEAKEAKEAAEKAAEEAGQGAEEDAPKDDDPMAAIEAKRAAMEEKLAAMDPEKAAKVRAGFEAKLAKEIAALEEQASTKEQAAAKEQPQEDPEIAAKRAAMEEKLAGMDPEKAAKVRAGFEAKLAREAAQKGGE